MQHVFEAQFMPERSTMLFSDDYLVIIKLSSFIVWVFDIKDRIMLNTLSKIKIYYILIREVKNHYAV